MSRKNKPLPLLEQVEITDIAAEGKSLARVNDLVVFAPYLVPGDVVDLQVRKKKHSYAEAEVVRFHKYSPQRIQPVCRHFGVCGGCKWQCLGYEDQLRYKQKQVFDALTRIGKVEFPEMLPIKGSLHQYGYRNKLEFGFSNKKWLTREQINSEETFDNMNALGFHIPGAFDKILDIEQCFLMDDVNNKIRNGIREYALQNNLTFFDLRKQTGLLRNIMLRTSDTGELMLLFQFHAENETEHAQANAMLEYLRSNFPEITSLLYVNNLKANDTVNDLEIKTYAGTDFIYEQMDDLRFKVGPKSFYQTNTHQAFELYKVARDFAALKSDDLVYDLYTGTGTIANFVARDCRHVIGIEYVPEAIEDAKVNSEINHIDNTEFYAGDMKDILTNEFIDRHGRPNVIITDPPRAGMHTDVVATILNARPERIVYVSCNPATQARDLALLTAEGNYRITAVQPVDMFPQTHHVENVVQLTAI